MSDFTISATIDCCLRAIELVAIVLRVPLYPDIFIILSGCITWFQIQLIFNTCQIRYHTHCGIIVALDSSET